MTAPPIDLEAAEATFAASTDRTVGLEEEYAICDPETLLLVPGFERLRDAAVTEDPVLSEAICGELIRSEIEIISGPGEDIGDALSRQRDRRRRLFAHAARHGVVLGSAGTHPLSDYRDQAIIDTEHYHRVEDGLKYVAWRNNTFSMHVHVGVRDLERAIAVCDRLRPVLPLLLAVSANSPFVDGRDSGLHSARTQTFTKSFPRCGVPDHFGSWAAYKSYLEFLMETGSIVEFTQVWWSIRPHLRFGTVEVRICDAQTTAAESDALAELIVASVAQAARDHDDGVPYEPVPPRLVEENLWRAVRHGLDGRLVDFERAEEYAAPGVKDRLLRWTAPVRAELGIDPRLAEHNGAQRQRRRIAAGETPKDVYALLVRETRESHEEVPA